MWTASHCGLGSLECRHRHSSVLTLLPSITVPPHCEPKSNFVSLSCFHQLQQWDTRLTPVLMGDHGKFWRLIMYAVSRQGRWTPEEQGPSLSGTLVRESLTSAFVYQSEALFSADWLVPGVERRMWCVELWVPLFRKPRKCLWRMEVTHNQVFSGGSC